MCVRKGTEQSVLIVAVHQQHAFAALLVQNRPCKSQKRQVGICYTKRATYCTTPWTALDTVHEVLVLLRAIVSPSICPCPKCPVSSGACGLQLRQVLLRRKLLLLH